MAATRLIAMHPRQGRSVAKSLGERTDYAKNPEKTEKGDLVTTYQCDPFTVDEEFMLQKRQYNQITGKSQHNDVIAYQIRQSFKPGEVTADEANRIGYELALRFTKGKYSFIVATHTDRAHIHNHVVFNSTSIDGTRKFKDFWRSGLALQKLSDLICLEHGLSVIERKPYDEREKRTKYPVKEGIRGLICQDIDEVLLKKPKDFDAFLEELKKAGYEIKAGKNVAVKSKSQKRFVRLSSLPDGFRESDIRQVLSGAAEHHKYAGKTAVQHRQRSVSLIIDIQKKCQEKGPGYQQWAKVHNVKQLAQSVYLMRERGYRTISELSARADDQIKKRDDLLASIKASEARMAEIATLRKHIINYSKTRKTYEEYRKAGYSKKFFEAHREEITLHKAAKQAFDDLGVKKIPKVKDLNTEYAELLAKKKAAYSEYRRIKEDAQELLIAKMNIESFYEADQKVSQEHQRQEKQH
ncbi:MAG: relaxase/mobilization nuclease domain-containing protein [Oscillospiraceae bacterium]|nr:relaxase/mobilization nuclease domain-containing protein [Oscillospiraceae bacterium]